MEDEEDVYSDEARGRLELIWGDGFLSPGGSAEVARILGGHSISGLSVLDIGSGAGGTWTDAAADGEVIGSRAFPGHRPRTRD